MSFLLKIVEGPNKGAEIALVEGVAVTIGKMDDCDIVLADPTMPDVPFTIEATASGVTINGEPIEPYHVKSAGSTAFAIGPSDAAWGELVWEQRETGSGEQGTEDAEKHESADEKRDEGSAPTSDVSSPESGPEPETPPKRRRGCFGCLLWLIALLLILLALGWFFKDRLRPKAEEVWGRLTGKASNLTADGKCRQGNGSPAQNAQEQVLPGSELRALAAKYGLSFTNDAGRTTLSGNFRTRAERLVATAEAYESQPGVELDFSDDESFGTAAADALFTLTEGAMKVSTATNRVLSITGVAPSADALKKTLEALNADLPKLRNVDVTGVKLGGTDESEEDDIEDDPTAPSRGTRRASRRRRAMAKKSQPSFPVCGILTMPYPCLVMQDGRRILEGATVGDSVILQITSDSVTVTNASGRFTWKP